MKALRSDVRAGATIAVTGLALLAGAGVIAANGRVGTAMAPATSHARRTVTFRAPEPPRSESSVNDAWPAWTSTEPSFQPPG